MSNKTTLMDQFFALKKEAGGALILLRLGDFFELFYDDAKIACDTLGLVLTKREWGAGQTAPMCGFPAHALDTYAGKLASCGYKVAICEQKKSENSTLMDRVITRIITPGTITDDALLERDSNNYLLSLYSRGDVVGAAWTDVSTGEVNYSSAESLQQLNNLIARLSPSEIICNCDMATKSALLSVVKNGLVCPFTLYGEQAFAYEDSFKRLTNKFGVQRVGTMIERLTAKRQKAQHCVSALGALFAYIESVKIDDTQCVDPLEAPAFETMKLGSNVFRALELFKNISDNKKQGSLLWVLDQTKTAMGARTLKKWLSTPLCDKEGILRRHEGVEELFNSDCLQEIADSLSGISDLERIGTSLSRKNIGGKECLRIAQSLTNIVWIKNRLNKFKSPILVALNEGIDGCQSLLKLISFTINAAQQDFAAWQADTNSADITLQLKELEEIKATDSGLVEKVNEFEVGVISGGVNKELDQIRAKKDEADKYMQYILSQEVELTGLKLRLERSATQGFYFEVPKAQVTKLPYRFQRIQSLATCERFKTDILSETERVIFDCENTALALESRIFDTLMAQIRSFSQKLVKSAKSLSSLDCLTSFAVVAKMYNYVRPKIIDGDKINIKDGRHAVVERCTDSILSTLCILDPKQTALESVFSANEEASAKFVPNDTVLDAQNDKIMLITGPNMSGKSVYMRQVALIVIMAHVGSFVPASSAEICIVDQIFTRIGAGDDVSRGQSTFMVEMVETANVLDAATDHSLIILDEMGRGTSTYDGVSIAWAILESLAKNYKAKVLFSTHYHELTELENAFSCIKNYKMTTKDSGNSITFLRKLSKGGAQKSFGIEVAQLAGVDNKIVSRAREVMKKLEKTQLI